MALEALLDTKIRNGDNHLSAFPHSAVFRPPTHLFSSHRPVYWNYFVLGYQSIGWLLVKRHRRLRPPVWCPQETPIYHPICALDNRSGRTGTLRLLHFDRPFRPESVLNLLLTGNY